jgi:hypothetical protein
MKKIIRLTESDLERIIGRVIQEQKNEQLITEGISDILKKIKSKFSKQKENKLESELENGLDINRNSTKEEVINKVKDFFGEFTSKDEMIYIAASLGSAFKVFTYLVLLMGADFVSENDPITFVAIAIYMFLHIEIKIGDKTFRFRN